MAVLSSQDYRDHRDKILNKFVSMIEELIEARSSSLKHTDWDTPGGGRGRGGKGATAGATAEASGAGGEGGGGDPCQFTADVRKAVTAMHNILQQQLPAEQLQVGLGVRDACTENGKGAADQALCIEVGRFSFTPRVKAESVLLQVLRSIAVVDDAQVRW